MPKKPVTRPASTCGVRDTAGANKTMLDDIHAVGQSNATHPAKRLRPRGSGKVSYRGPLFDGNFVLIRSWVRETVLILCAR